MRWFPRLVPAASNNLLFAIGLRTGQTLVIETRAPYVLNWLGLPVGFGAGLLGTLIAVAALLIMQRETKPLARLAAAVDQMNLSSEPGAAAGRAPQRARDPRRHRRLQAAAGSARQHDARPPRAGRRHLA